MSKKEIGIVQRLKMLFGLFMVLVYVGVAVLLALNVLDWPRTTLWTVARWVLAVVFGAYGIYRGYRELNGEHTYGMRIQDDDEQYSTYHKTDRTDEKV